MEPIWLEIAEDEMEVAEVSGPEANPRIVEYLQSTSLGFPYNESDETPWCSAFVNWVITQAGLDGTDSAWARSWLNWGRKAVAGEFYGAICVLKRGKSSGHVGFLTAWDDDSLSLFLYLNL